MGRFTGRMMRAARLDPQVYEEIEADPTAMGQAMAVVVLSSVATGIGSVSTGGAPHLILMTIAALIGWYLWAFLIYLIGAKLLPETETRADYMQMLRALGFSSAPGVLRVLGAIPFLAKPVFMVTGIWMLVAMVIAVRQALDYKSTWRAVGVCVIGWLVSLLFMGLLLFFMMKAG